MSNSGLIRLSHKEFETVSKFVYDQCGIRLPEAKKILLESRLNKRLRALNMTEFGEYIKLVTSKEAAMTELIEMIDVVTTNKTDFFREAHHFTFLSNEILPPLYKRNNKVKIFSAACSSGEEPYTLAMVLQEFKNVNLGFDYHILASDISTQVLDKAIKAIYGMDKISDVPLSYRQKYLLKSKDKEKPTVRIVSELRNKVSFARVNLMDDLQYINESFDVIFCRNVLIYFDKEIQQMVVSKLLEKLKPGGYFIIGHSESLMQSVHPVNLVKPTIYQKKS